MIWACVYITGALTHLYIMTCWQVEGQPSVWTALRAVDKAPMWIVAFWPIYAVGIVAGYVIRFCDRRGK